MEKLHRIEKDFLGEKEIEFDKILWNPNSKSKRKF